MVRSFSLAVIAMLATAAVPVAAAKAEPRCLVIEVFAAATDEAAGPLTARLEG